MCIDTHIPLLPIIRKLIMKKLFPFLIILIIACGCNSVNSKKQITVNNDFLKEVVSILKENSIYSEKTEWDSLKVILNREYKSLENDTLKAHAVNRIFKEFDFKHHFFMSKEAAQRWKNQSDDMSDNKTIPKHKYVTGKFIEPDIGYLKVPSFSSGDSVQLKLFAKIAQQEQKRLSDKGAKKWIVDLTQNRGGNMWPMLAGLSPLIGDGKAGYFVTKSKDIVGTWNIENGDAFLEENDSITYSVQIAQSTIDFVNHKTAILISGETASSGEALLMSFLGKKNVKTFGVKTANYTTSNSDFELSDGSILWVTVSYMADRNLRTYPNGISPMEKVQEDSLLIKKAIFWLNEN